MAHSLHTNGNIASSENNAMRSIQSAVFNICFFMTSPKFTPTLQKNSSLSQELDHLGMIALFYPSTYTYCIYIYVVIYIYIVINQLYLKNYCYSCITKRRNPSFSRIIKYIRKTLRPLD